MTHVDETHIIQVYGRTFHFPYGCERSVCEAVGDFFFLIQFFHVLEDNLFISNSCFIEQHVKLLSFLFMVRPRTILNSVSGLVGWSVGWSVCLNTNFKTSNLCLNDQAYNCLIHFSSSLCIIHQASCIMQSESSNYKLGRLDKVLVLKFVLTQTHQPTQIPSSRWFVAEP